MDSFHTAAFLATLGHLSGGSSKHMWKCGRKIMSDGQNEEEEPWHTQTHTQLYNTLKDT